MAKQDSCVLYVSSPKVTLCRTLAQQCNKDVSTDTIHWPYSDCPWLSCTEYQSALTLCIAIACRHSWIPQHSQDRKQFQHLKVPFCCSLIALSAFSTDTSTILNSTTKMFIFLFYVFHFKNFTSQSE